MLTRPRVAAPLSPSDRAPRRPRTMPGRSIREGAPHQSSSLSSSSGTAPIRGIWRRNRNSRTSTATMGRSYGTCRFVSSRRVSRKTSLGQSALPPTPYLLIMPSAMGASASKRKKTSAPRVNAAPASRNSCRKCASLAAAKKRPCIIGGREAARLAQYGSAVKSTSSGTRWPTTSASSSGRGVCSGAVAETTQSPAPLSLKASTASWSAASSSRPCVASNASSSGRVVARNGVGESRMSVPAARALYAAAGDPSAEDSSATTADSPAPAHSIGSRSAGLPSAGSHPFSAACSCKADRSMSALSSRRYAPSTSAEAAATIICEVRCLAV
mmetsp:Transcript_69987/g.192119  ORF Transcript_69987/g.192119 Transcript_69987/m.192119 type:complete len:328 (-) Transcript_69987:386-1369(-)